MKSEIKRSFVDTLPVMAGYLVLGVGFGVLMKSNGYGVLWTLGMSLFIYAGSMQYLAVSLLTAGASLISAAVTTLMVNARHLFYGISMVDKYKNAGWIKPYLIFALSDETYSLVCNGNHSRAYYFFVSLFDQIYWICGSVLGAILGSVLKFNTAGIDFALTALFITVFIDQWRTAEKHRWAVIGVLISVVCLLVFGAEKFLIPSMLIITAVLLAIHTKGDARNE